MTTEKTMGAGAGGGREVGGGGGCSEKIEKRSVCVCVCRGGLHKIKELEPSAYYVKRL